MASANRGKIIAQWTAALVVLGSATSVAEAQTRSVHSQTITTGSAASAVMGNRAPTGMVGAPSQGAFPRPAASQTFPNSHSIVLPGNVPTPSEGGQMLFYYPKGETNPRQLPIHMGDDKKYYAGAKNDKIGISSALPDNTVTLGKPGQPYHPGQDSPFYAYSSSHPQFAGPFKTHDQAQQVASLLAKGMTEQQIKAQVSSLSATTVTQNITLSVLGSTAQAHASVQIEAANKAGFRTPIEILSFLSIQPDWAPSVGFFSTPPIPIYAPPPEKHTFCEAWQSLLNGPAIYINVDGVDYLLTFSKYNPEKTGGGTLHIELANGKNNFGNVVCETKDYKTPHGEIVHKDDVTLFGYGIYKGLAVTYSVADNRMIYHKGGIDPSEKELKMARFLAETMNAGTKAAAERAAHVTSQAPVENSAAVVAAASPQPSAEAAAAPPRVIPPVVIVPARKSEQGWTITSHGSANAVFTSEGRVDISKTKDGFSFNYYNQGLVGTMKVDGDQLIVNLDGAKLKTDDQDAIAEALATTLEAAEQVAGVKFPAAATIKINPDKKAADQQVVTIDVQNWRDLAPDMLSTSEKLERVETAQQADHQRIEELRRQADQIAADAIVAARHATELEAQHHQAEVDAASKINVLKGQVETLGSELGAARAAEGNAENAIGQLRTDLNAARRDADDRIGALERQHQEDEDAHTQDVSRIRRLEGQLKGAKDLLCPANPDADFCKPDPQRGGFLLPQDLGPNSPYPQFSMQTDHGGVQLAALAANDAGGSSPVGSNQAVAPAALAGNAARTSATRKTTGSAPAGKPPARNTVARNVEPAVAERPRGFLSSLFRSAARAITVAKKIVSAFKSVFTALFAPSRMLRETPAASVVAHNDNDNRLNIGDGSANVVKFNSARPGRVRNALVEAQRAAA